jgi:nucleotide-binding universal stress UspA family protein
MMYNKILVLLDGSHLAELILPHVVYLASRLKLEVVLLRTYSLPTEGYFLTAHVPPPDMAELREKTRREVEDYLRAATAKLSAAGIEAVSTVVMEGRGPEKIIELAQKTPGVMVAMSTHGRSGIGRWVLGSVTDRVVSHCGEPVLVIRPAAAVK